MQALIIIDPQMDFCPGGALAVADGDSIMPVINNHMDDFELIVITQDWHPKGHSSFASSHPNHNAYDTVSMPYGDQILWPDHCIAGTNGAAFHPALMVDRANAVIRKGCNPAVDSYSAFFENDRKSATGLAGLLQERGVDSVLMLGLATDFCVAWSALDGAKLGLDVRVDLSACRAIDLDGSLDAALDNMHKAGVTIIA